MKAIKNLYFKSDFGNIVYDKYLPQAHRGVVIQIAHGMIEHRGRYVWLCEQFAKAGYVVYINDHRGHGDSIGGEVRQGEMGKDGFEKATKDMHTLTQIIIQEYPTHKLILLGHSMGSLLSRRFLQLYGEELDALILTGTPSPHPMLGLGVAFFRLLDILGITSTPKIGHLLSFQSKFAWRLKPQKDPLKTHWACSDESVIKEYLADPKSRFRFTPNSFANLFKGMRKVFSAYPEVFNPALPVLFVSGEDDICGDFSEGVKKAYKHLKSQGYEDVSLKLYAKTRHEVFNEPNKLEILQDTLSWLESKGL